MQVTHLRPEHKPQPRRGPKRTRNHGLVPLTFAPAEPVSQPGRTNTRIVIADSSKRFCAGVGVYLSRLGYQTRAVHDLRQLTQTLFEWQPTTLFLNSSLPALDMQALDPLYPRLPRDFRIILLLEPGLPILLPVPPQAPCLARLFKTPNLADLRHFL